MTQERVHFRMYHMQCCESILCNVNARHFTYCPNCGKMVYPEVKGWATFIDQEARLSYHVEGVDLKSESEE